MMSQSSVLIACVLALLVVVVVVSLRHTGVTGKREQYGPPPGAWRAMTLKELGDRGWAESPMVYHGVTASSVAHMVERSA